MGTIVTEEHESHGKGRGTEEYVSLSTFHAKHIVHENDAVLLVLNLKSSPKPE